MTTLFEKEAPHPLADRLRPQRLADIVGQHHLLGPEGPIGRMVASRQLASMILWGPPGCGKTTIARLLAQELSKSGTDLAFEPLSAVFSGVADLRKVFEAAKSGSKARSVPDLDSSWARSRAIVVLPQPGGPHRIIEASCRLATMRPIGPSGPSR